MSLTSALHKLLQGRTMGVGEMAEAEGEHEAGIAMFEFRTIVNAALLSKQGKQMFRKVARGQYTAK